MPSRLLKASHSTFPKEYTWLPAFCRIGFWRKKHKGHLVILQLSKMARTYGISRGGTAHSVMIPKLQTPAPDKCCAPWEASKVYDQWLWSRKALVVIREMEPMALHTPRQHECRRIKEKHKQANEEPNTGKEPVLTVFPLPSSWTKEVREAHNAGAPHRHEDKFSCVHCAA